MSVLVLLFSATAAAESATKVFEEVVTPGELVVRVHSHALETQRGRISVWTFVSDGLKSAKQKELIFTVMRAAGETEKDYPRDLLNLYRTVHSFARAGRLVEVGGLTRIGSAEPGLLGRRDFRCVLYTPYQPLDGVPVAGPALTALIVTSNECDALAFGLTRVMARLGYSERYYPTAPWANRERAEVIGPTGNAGSVLGSMLLMSVPKAWVRRERDGRVILTLGAGADLAIEQLIAKAKEGVPVAWLVTIDPTADACLVWWPGQKESAAISRPKCVGDRVAANFLAFAVPVEHDKIGLVEDGVGIGMTPATWKRVEAALQKHVALSLPELGKGFNIVWASERNETPSPAANPAAAFVVSHLVLYQPDAVVGERVGAPELVAYLKQLEAVAIASIGGVPTSEKLDIVCPLRRAATTLGRLKAPAAQD